MKILLIQSTGKHPRNKIFREALCFDRAFSKPSLQGVQSIVTGIGYKNYPNFNKLLDWCDVVFVLENYDRNNWIPCLADCKKYKVFLNVDSHCVFGRLAKYAEYHKFNMVLSAPLSDVNKFKRPGRLVRYFPNCYDDELIDKMNINKEYDIGFCGNYANRKAWIDELTSSVGLHRDIFVIGKDMVKAINSYKIHFNRNMKYDINYRTFETLGCGTFLLTNRTAGLEKLFVIDRHLVTYNDINDCIKKIRYYINNNKERKRIACAGYNHVKRNHTFNVRAQQFVDIMKEVV